MSSKHAISSAGRALTELHHGVLRSAFAGQGNAIQVSPRLSVLDRRSLPLNPRRFRAAKARELGLRPPTRLAWAKERRVAQAVRLAVKLTGAPRNRLYERALRLSKANRR